ncbi:hypothetical protein [Streptomyces hoynatensis]|uniref:Uncharacterized protein n=1 Tax=Streptomyces hoynatensis TaxID=1141874 RepID=A0A3A9Z7Q3_9ACTN|nr:hypothetical protein [Streptomyces hoynatensis]RKN43246.1 hypothetical protein D7294_11565 [Streptomyces hoynatensis]
MEAVWASVVAVVGTLLGSVSTYAFQRLASRRSESFTRSEALRQERIDTFSAFAAAVEEYRRGQADRWHRRQEDPDGEGYAAARSEAHRLRTAARQALYRVKLLTGDPEVLLAAERAYDCTRDVPKARDWAKHEARITSSKEAIEGFVARASPLVR